MAHEKEFWATDDDEIDSIDDPRDNEMSLHGDGVTSMPSRPVSVRGDDDTLEQVFGYGGRVVPNPYQHRLDIGEIGVLTANFGRESRDANKRLYTRANLKASPATILGLQEAEEAVSEILASICASIDQRYVGQAEGLTTAPAPAVAGQGRGLTDVSQRPQASFLVIMGDEYGPTCLTAVRASMAEEINRLQWYWNMDGRWKQNGVLKVARSRVLVCEIRWRRRLANMHRLVHANVHFHHKTAKRHTGFAEAHTTFFRHLHGMIVQHDVRILSGDFNMSVFQTISILRGMGLVIDLGAIYPWKPAHVNEPYSDSSAIFLIGGCQDIRLRFSLASFGDYGGGSSSSQQPVPDPAVAPADGDGDRSHGSGSIQELDVFEKGQGYALGSYLPKNRRAFAETIVAMFTKTTDLDPLLKDSPHLLPRWKQKLINIEMFDPSNELFQSGAHMPLLGFLGKAPTRSDAKLTERETKRREKLKAKRHHGHGANLGDEKGRGKGSGKSRDTSKGKGKDSTTQKGKGEETSSSFHGHGTATSLYGHWGADQTPVYCAEQSGGSFHGHGTADQTPYQGNTWWNQSWHWHPSDANSW